MLTVYSTASNRSGYIVVCCDAQVNESGGFIPSITA